MWLLKRSVYRLCWCLSCSVKIQFCTYYWRQMTILHGTACYLQCSCFRLFPHWHLIELCGYTTVYTEHKELWLKGMWMRSNFVSDDSQYKIYFLKPLLWFREHINISIVLSCSEVLLVTFMILKLCRWHCILTNTIIRNNFLLC